MRGTRIRRLWTVLIAFFLGLAASLSGCVSVGPATPVAVADIKAVTGTWQGLVYLSSQVEPDRVTLTIREDASYEVVSAQQPIGTSSGRGKITISGGRLIFEGQRGHGLGRLLRDPDGNLTMEVDATLSDNTTLTAKLGRTK